MHRHQRYLRTVFVTTVMLSIIGAFAGFGVSLIALASYPELTGWETGLSMAGGTVVGGLAGLMIAVAALGNHSPH